MTGDPNERTTQAMDGATSSARWFVVRFLVVLVALYTAYAYTKHTPQFEAHREFLTVLASVLLDLRYDGVSRVGTFLLAPGQDGVQVAEGCDAIYAILCFVGGVVAFRSTWKEKFVGLAFGLGAIEKIDKLEVRWPSGKTTSVEAPETGRYHRIAAPGKAE